MGQYRSAGILAYMEPAERRAMLARSVIDCQGVMKHVAFELGYSRRHMYRLIHQYRLWPVMNKVRIKRLEKKARERRRT